MTVRIAFDSNALYSDPVMVREVSTKVLELLVPARATIVFSPVVLGELNRQRRDRVDDLRDPIRNRIKKLATLAGVDPGTLLEETQALVEAADDRWTSRWNEILSDDNVEVGEWPTTDSQMMAERELARRRPFLDTDNGTIGHRDTLIWLHVLELVQEDPSDHVIFVTADKGFLSGNGLHPHLIEDLGAAGGRHTVTCVGSMHALVAELEKATETSGWETWRVPRVSELLYDEIQDLGGYDFAEHWDPRDGGTEAPTFDVGLPFTGHDWELNNADGPQDLEIEAAQFGADELIVTFLLDIHLSGFMDKFEWYSDDHPEVDLWDADWNDHLVSVEATRRVRMRARFEIDDQEEVAHFDEFLSAEVVPEPGAVALG